MAEALALVRGSALVFLFRPPVHVFGIGKRKGKPDFACRLGRLFSLSRSLLVFRLLFWCGIWKKGHAFGHILKHYWGQEDFERSWKYGRQQGRRSQMLADRKGSHRGR